MPHGKSPRHTRKKKAPDRKPRGPGASPDEMIELEGPGKPVRIQRILAAAGLASRRGAEQFLRDGRVTVNGEPAQLGDSADPSRDVVALDGERLAREPLSYWMAHKPRGMVTTLSDPEGRPTVAKLLPRDAPRLFPVGRLDMATSGLVLLTNDGELAHRLLHPSLGNEREYRVTVRGELLAKGRSRLERGVRLEDGITAPARVDRVKFDEELETTTFHLVISEGKKRQIRRSLQALGHPVKRLARVRMGPIRLGRLPRGSTRPLRPDEIDALINHSAELRQQAKKSRAPGRRRGFPRTPRSAGGK